MSALLLLLAAAATPHKAVPHAGPSAAKRRELVLKAKINAWRGEWRIEPAGVACKSSKSTGDERLDTIGCRAIQVCYAPKVPQVAAIEEAPGTDGEKKARVAALLNAGKACVARNQAAAIEIIAGTRKPPPMVVVPPADAPRKLGSGR